jgi:DNA replication protein DnaC
MPGSIIITSQLPIKDWHVFIGEPTIADAIIDRLLNVSYKFELRGGSMRKKQKDID